MNRSTGVLLPQGMLLVGELLAPAGTRMPFNQSAAPLGWTIDASSTLTDCTAVARQGSGGTTGGSTAWSGFNFGNTLNVNAFSLSVSQLPSHSHPVVDPGHVMTTGAVFPFVRNNSTTIGLGTISGSTSMADGSIKTTDASVSNAAIANNGSGTNIQPTYSSPQVKFTDHIVGVRS